MNPSRIGRLLSSYTFRYTIAYIVILSLAVFVVLGVVYAINSYQFTNSVTRNIALEWDALLESYEGGGVEGTRSFISQREAQARARTYFYLLLDRDNNKLAGNLDEWPASTRYPAGWLSFELDLLQRDSSLLSQDQEAYVGRWQDLPDGGRLLVARYYEDVVSYYRLVAGILWQGVVVTIVLGTIAGAITTTLWLRRIESINRSIQKIMEGDLSKRIPVMSRGGGDFEELIRNFNNMLDRIESLMHGVRQVSDNIAHDLRTPLTRLRNHLVQLQLGLNDATEEDVDHLIHEADALLITFNALLRIARIESDNQRSGFADTRLSVILEDVVELYEPVASEAGLQLELDTSISPVLWADRDLLFQAVANLVDNAIKYAGEKGHVEVSAKVGVGGIEIIVADDGIGIPLEDRDNVFRRFFRVEASRGVSPGNGLGLSLVAAVVKLHQGYIRLEDNEPGLAVVITLPIGRS
ncbi:MAG: HAMP domain-containing sensor histidine kinase [Pseudomonadales bacterium]